MRSLAEHLSVVVGRTRPLEPLALPLLDARGCVLAVDVTSPVAVPGLHTCKVSGYAARAGDIAMASPASILTLRELPPGVPLAPGTVIPVTAGSPLPVHANCVIPLAFTDRGVPLVRVGRAVATGENVTLAGSEIGAGSVLLTAGTVLTSNNLALLAAVGIGKIPAYPRPRVAVLTTGSELLDASRLRGMAPPQGLKPDVNGALLATAVVEADALTYRVGPVPDDPAVLRKVLDDQLGRADMVVTTGGIGTGANDVLRPVLATMGTVDFAALAISPGAVHGVGSLGVSNVPLVSLPGDPIAAFVGFHLFVRPMIRRLKGMQDVFARRHSVVVDADFAGSADVDNFLPVALSDHRVQALPETLLGYMAADGLLLLPAGQAKIAAGETATIIAVKDQ